MAMFKSTLALCSVCTPAVNRVLGTRSFRAAARVAAGSQQIGSRTSSGPIYKEGIHRSNAQKLVNKVPVIEVPSTVAVCDGGSGALGHPVEYIQLDTVSNEPAVCKYCGLRFKMGKVHHH